MEKGNREAEAMWWGGECCNREEQRWAHHSKGPAFGMLPQVSRPNAYAIHSIKETCIFDKPFCADENASKPKSGEILSVGVGVSTLPLIASQYPTVWILEANQEEKNSTFF